MSRTFSFSLIFLIVCVAAIPRKSGGATAQTAAQVEPQFSMEVEPYCSETKLRTSNARIRWSLPKETLVARKLAGLAGAKQNLEATVYRDGFEKGLMVSIPLAQASEEHPLVALSAEKKPKLRAFDFRVIAFEQPKDAAAMEAGSSSMGVVVEGLEPGVNYTWRITLETDSGRIMSEPTTGRAVVCPADMVPGKPPAQPTPRRIP